MFYLWLCVTSYLEKFINHAIFCNYSRSNSVKHKMPFHRLNRCIFNSFEVLVKYLRINAVYVFCHIRLALIYLETQRNTPKSLCPVLHLYIVYWNIPATKTKQKQKPRNNPPPKKKKQKKTIKGYTEILIQFSSSDSQNRGRSCDGLWASYWYNGIATECSNHFQITPKKWRSTSNMQLTMLPFIPRIYYLLTLPPHYRHIV